MSNETTDYYKIKKEEADKYEDFVISILCRIGLPILMYHSQHFQYNFGENVNGFEIKFDGNIEKYGNLYIEISEKSNPANPNYIPSGIYRQNNSWLFIIGNYKQIHILSIEQLKLQHKTGNWKETEQPTSRGFLLKKQFAIDEKLILKSIYIKDEIVKPLF